MSMHVDTYDSSSSEQCLLVSRWDVGIENKKQLMTNRALPCDIRHYISMTHNITLQHTYISFCWWGWGEGGKGGRGG